MSAIDVPQENTVDILGQAYRREVSPDPFTGEKRNLTQLAAARLSMIEFAAYWTNLFRDFRDKYNGNPAGYVAQETFQAAEKLDGSELHNAVAQQLAEFGDRVLEAGLDIPNLPAFSDETLTGLAAFLIEKRNQLEGVGMKLGAQPREISDDWVRFASQLDQTQNELAQFILGEASELWNAEERDTDAEVENDQGRIGGYTEFHQQHALQVVLAKVLARYFPDMLIGKLKEAPRYEFKYAAVEETRGKVAAALEE